MAPVDLSLTSGPARRLRRAAALAGLAALGLATVVAGPPAALGATPVGYDVSYPQCGKALPVGAAFTILGVNGGKPFTANPCLGAGTSPSELAWAGPATAFYVNTANPGPGATPRWPVGQATPQPCGTPASPGTDTASCAYDYGWNAGADAYATLVAAEWSLGWVPPGATATATPGVWWLDVEGANSWRGNQAFNVASLQGEVDVLHALGAAGVGLYSVAGDWKAITGNTTAFGVLASWVAGPSTRGAALALCGGPGFTGGGVALVQYPSGGFDGNVRCAAAPAPAPVAPPLALAFAGAPPVLRAGAAPATVTVADNGPQAVPVGVTLASSSPQGLFAPGPAGPWTPTLTLTIAPGGTAVSALYRDTHAARPLLSASTPGTPFASERPTVVPGPLASLAVTPSRARLRVGGAQAFAVVGRDAFGNRVPTAARWSAPAALGRSRPAVSAHMRLIATRAGRGTVTARAHGLVARAALTVRSR